MREYNRKITGEALTIVSATNTATAAGSGSLQVFGTPFMIALMEEATCNAVSDLLEDNETTVGTAINVTHDKASGIGTVIHANATLTDIDRRKLTFEVVAKEENGAVIGKGTIQRFLVDSKRFMKKVEAK